MAPVKHLPPMDGSINVLPGFVDFHAEHNPSLPWARFPSSAHEGGFHSISFLEFSRATHRIAHALKPERQGVEGEVVAVLVHCDSILYLALLAGMTRAGLVPFPMSPRNSPEAVCQMLQQTACRRMVVNSAMLQLASAVQTMMQEKYTPVDLIPLPELHAIFPALNGKEEEDVDSYPPYSMPVSLDDPVLILHSSGSTGFPKPVPQTHRIILQWCHAPIVYRSRDQNIRWACPALPTFHAMGIIMQFYAPLASGEYSGLYTPNGPSPPAVPNPQNVIETSKVTGCNGLVMTPSFIEIWAQSPENTVYLKSLDILAFAGGPLSDINGNKLAAAGVKLFAVYGGTEFGVPTDVFDVDTSKEAAAHVKTSADWAWMQFGGYVNANWIPQGDGTSELQFLSTSTHQPAVENLTDAKGYATSDLWEPHPTKKGLWRIVGRTDDVIVLGSGEKIVAIPQEGLLGSLPFTSGAIMFGRGKTQAGILLEPRPEFSIDPTDEKAVTEFRNKIWPFVEEANKSAPSFARIFKEMILVTDPRKPMERAGKGTVIRKRVVDTYTREIDRLYVTIEASTSANGVDPPSSWSLETVEDWLMQHAATINKGTKLSATADMFEQGFDSLSATYLRNRILGALRSSSDEAARNAAVNIPQEFVFTHPTLQLLARAVVHLISPQQVHKQPQSGEKEIVELIAKYCADLPDFRARVRTAMSGDAVVLLTGSTGNLGSHVLAALLRSHGVKKVFTLDRGTAPIQRLQSSFLDRGLPQELLRSEKLVPSVGDLSKPDLGLDAQTLTVIQHTVTHIIHNAWKLDFNLALGSFQGHISGARNLVDFSASCDNPVKLVFSSSVAAAQAWPVSNGPVPEAILADPAVAIGTGYGSSKYIVERVLGKAKEKGLATLSVRIGQLAGSTTSGAWNVSDWVPIIVKSSISLGYLPDLKGLVDWTPVDVAAQAIADVIQSSGPLPDVINLVHPHPAPWAALFSAVNASLGGNLQAIPFSDWFSRVEAYSAHVDEQTLNYIPAIKLLKFLSTLTDADGALETPLAGGSPSYQNASAQKLSSALTVAKTIDSIDVRKWMKYWQRHSGGFSTVG